MARKPKIKTEIELRRNPVCSKCGEKGLNFPKTGFAVIYDFSLAQKEAENLPDGLCRECHEQIETKKKTANAIGKPRFKWLEEQKKRRKND